MDPFPSSSEGRETPTLPDPLEITNLNHWTFCFLVFRIIIIVISGRSVGIVRLQTDATEFFIIIISN
jgi:hypothetical protein